MKNFFAHFKLFIFRGLLALIPIGLAIFTIRIIYVFIDKQVLELLDQFIGYRVPGLGLFVFIIFLYLTGMVTSNVFGRRLFAMFEHITVRIPIVKLAYQVGKQLSYTLSLPEKQIFKKAVLVDCLKSGTWAIGFITGEIRTAESKEVLYKVFIPTVPNPTTGFVILAKEHQVKYPDWSVEEAIKMVISGGIIGPETISKIH